MILNESPRKEFADNMVQIIKSLAGEYKLNEVVIQQKADPMLIAVRGCLKGTTSPVEIVVLVPDNIPQTELSSRLITEVNAQLPTAQVYRSFDISEAIAKETAVSTSLFDSKLPTDDDQRLGTNGKSAPPPVK